ncbi:unnamed protein product [Triticum turgidum subsp. durum]|uniref:Uncharacterized protein n=1 Tax=Triticum turgidum subsp. durum TaxID=4567 RepID=A0A9R0QGT7_TRITD|nr:unnamed protein product [Triticum turgidum subsp. durum]
MDKSNTSGCAAEDIIETRNYANSSLNPEALKHQSFPFPYTSLSGERKNFKRAANRGKKGSRVLSSRTYPLKSSESTVRVLRSRSVADKSPSDAVQTSTERAAKKPPSDSVDTLVKPAAKRIKRDRDRPTKGGPDDELSKIRKRIRYILNRMNYHQSFLEAYASEGWKNQSLEKIRPEKELERAKAEIVRCKLRIREAFQNLDHLLTVGKLEESLFDSEGKISSDDIVCATCSLQDVTLNNDIILCDGACDRGFHQNCLNPPLLTKDIPEGEEGWLCPACDCKIDCIELINELQGTDLDINDSWEKVFPEAAAVAHGPMQNDVADLPSDDSEDDDFDPNIPEEHVAGHAEGSSEEDGDEGSDSDDSNFMTSSDNSEHVKEKEKVDDLGLPSEDSEDDDYDPAGPDSDKDIEEKQDESDFTSDSDDFCAEIMKSCSKDEVSSGPKVGGRTNDLEGAPVRPNTSMSHTKDLEIDQDVILPSTKRQVQRLDYKKLYDDTYGEAPSESSDGDDWSVKSTLKEDNEEGNESNFTTSSDNPEDVKEKVDDIGLPSEDSEDDDYDPAGPGSHEDIGKNQSSSDKSHSSDKSENRKTKRKADDLGLPSEDSEDDDYDPASPDSDKDIEEKQDESDFSSDCDDFCVEIAKSCCGQEGVPSGAKVGGDRTDDLEGTTICANAAISNLPSKDPEMDQYVVLPVSARQKVQSPDSKKLAAYGKASSDSSYGEELSKKCTPEKDNGKESEAGSFVRQSNEFTPQRSQQSFHGSVNGQNAEELLTPNGSSTTGQKRQYGPIINQRLHEQFKTNQYPSRAVKESLAQELGLTFRQVEKWFESRRRHIRVASNKSSTHVENHSTKENPNVCKRDAVNEDTPSGSLNEGITQDGPLKQDIGGGLRTNASPPNSSQRYTTPLVRRPKGESRENHMKNTSSSSAGRPKGSDAGYAVLALEALDEKTRSKMLQELKKRKIG